MPNRVALILLILIIGRNGHQPERLPLSSIAPLCHPERMSRSPECSEGEGSLRPLMLVFHHEIDPPARHRAPFNRPLLLVSGQPCHVVLPLFEPCLKKIIGMRSGVRFWPIMETKKINRG